MDSKSRAEVFKLPCDGVERYSLKKTGPRSTYSDTYDSLFLVTGGKEAADGGRVFSLEGVQRIKALNQTYMKVAATFIQDWFAAEKKKREAAAPEPKP